jgi:hypothetical protein
MACPACDYFIPKESMRGQLLEVDERAAHMFVVNNGPAGQRGGQDLWGWVPSSVRRRVPWLPGPSPSTIIAAGTVPVLDTTRV